MKLLYLLIIPLLLTLSGCSKEQAETPPPTEVTDFIVEPKNIPAVFNFIGFAESSHPVEIRARVEGFLDTIAYSEGSLVQTGQLLFQLDPKQYKAKVEEAKGEVMRQQALVANAELTVNRLKPLYEQKAASKKDLDNATAQLLSSQASLQSAQANLLTAEINLGYTTIRSPITGLADKSKYREGALMTPGQQGLLTTVSVMDPIWIYFTVSDNDILRMTQQEKDLSLTLPKENEYEIEALMSDGGVYPKRGRVDFNSPTYDQSTGTLLVRAVFPNPQDLLRPGQFVRVKVYGAERKNALYVPQRALVQKKGGMFVYLISADNKVITQDVSTGAWEGDYQIITNGLKAGDRIVVDGTNKVFTGAFVKAVGNWKPSVTKTPSKPTQD